jgi:hypothetical protein
LPLLRFRILLLPLLSPLLLLMLLLRLLLLLRSYPALEGPMYRTELDRHDCR